MKKPKHSLCFSGKYMTYRCTHSLFVCFGINFLVLQGINQSHHLLFIEGEKACSLKEFYLQKRQRETLSKCLNCKKKKLIFKKKTFITKKQTNIFSSIYVF